MPRPPVDVADTRPAMLLFPVAYYDVDGDVIDTYEIYAQDLTAAVKIAARRVPRTSLATGFHVGRGKR